jgi:hypothetical protein
MRPPLILGLVLLCLPWPAGAQLVVFDNSHYNFGSPLYDDLRAQLITWGYAVEQRTTPLMENSDADVIVILPEDGYKSSGASFTQEEVDWLMAHVNDGHGLLAAVCPNDLYWANILELMNAFGIVEGDTYTEPAYYDQFVDHYLFDGVTALGDDYIYCTSLIASAPCVPVASDDNYDYIAIYDNDAGAGAAIWMSQYYMLSNEGIGDFDNLIFLEKAFNWLAQGGDVASDRSSWSQVKMLFD